ncbi:hypothetical protein PACTADRAFT_4789 [Pachysolen tannophilus NRRL Y-2460]|uniref:Uncharacterized protein n=1 Tax=Pachysolen tannophilus NRRL Y-2460 TaxID=669874 RepID=A0A1E4TQ67_PACTA|nr:hypothetical protein PACTADRAFT_4789 [Pachysolen tannophilus NRRL Y-2460]
MSNLAQTYLLASKVKSKLTKEAINPNADLRILVCQANLLDNLMDSLSSKKPLPNFQSEYNGGGNRFVDFSSDENEESNGGSNNSFYSTQVTTREILDDDEEEDEDEEDEEEYDDDEEILLAKAKIHTSPCMDEDINADIEEEEYEEDDEYYFSDDSYNSSDDEESEFEFTEVDGESPPSSPEDEDFLTALTKTNSNSNNNDACFLAPIAELAEQEEQYEQELEEHLHHDLPLLSHCSTVSSDESFEYSSSSEEEEEENNDDVNVTHHDHKRHHHHHHNHNHSHIHDANCNHPSAPNNEDVDYYQLSWHSHQPTPRNDAQPNDLALQLRSTLII